jgi:hypothetical protein
VQADDVRQAMACWIHFRGCRHKAAACKALNAPAGSRRVHLSIQKQHIRTEHTKG